MVLSDTVKGMVSKDYKERFVAEYEQLVIRYNHLNAMLKKWDAGQLEFIPNCPRWLYNFQILAMADYIVILEGRAVIEDIELPEV